MEFYLSLSTEMPIAQSTEHTEIHDECYGNRQLPSKTGQN